MSIELWLVYFGTVLAFMFPPGASHILMLSNSIGSGFKKSIATACGDLSANFLQMTAASLGLAASLQSSQQIFVVIKWAGVAYLVYSGLKLIFSNKSSFQASPSRSIRSLYWQGFITSASNPKAVIFFAALFPQFIFASEPLLPQFIALSVTYLFIDGLFLCFYGKSAAIFAKKFQSNIGRHFNKISGSLMISAAIILGVKNVD
ncbi:LysE family translocator [Marinomonas lutimaris]|uniref:LysE family translocator n=1 Tax=Marinomonas lutimaris TaxID=2846746 RepID=UPI001C67D0BD|nr:LysE family translocator [Marinomonas lutimaris]